MATESDRIRNEIEMTRAGLAANVDQLADRTSPTRVMRRGWNRFTDKMHVVSDNVMGRPAESIRQTTETVKEKASDATEKVGEMAGEAADAVKQAPRLAAEQTRGNPIAAGLIAFGAGLLAATLIPETEMERRMAGKLADSELAEKVREPLQEAASQMGQDVTETVKQSAGDMGQSVKDHAKQAKESISNR